MSKIIFLETEVYAFCLKCQKTLSYLKKSDLQLIWMNRFVKRYCQALEAPWPFEWPPFVPEPFQTRPLRASHASHPLLEVRASHPLLELGASHPLLALRVSHELLALRL